MISWYDFPVLFSCLSNPLQDPGEVVYEFSKSRKHFSLLKQEKTSNCNLPHDPHSEVLMKLFSLVIQDCIHCVNDLFPIGPFSTAF